MLHHPMRDPLSDIPLELIYVVASYLCISDLFAWSLTNNQYFSLLKKAEVSKPYSGPDYPVITTSLAENLPFDDLYLKKLRQISERNANAPVLIKQGEEIKMYALSNQNWDLTKLALSKETEKYLSFPSIKNKITTTISDARYVPDSNIQDHVYMMKFSDILKNNKKRTVRIERINQIKLNKKYRPGFWKDIDRRLKDLNEGIDEINTAVNHRVHWLCKDIFANICRKPYYFLVGVSACVLLINISKGLESIITRTLLENPYLLGTSLISGGLLFWQIKTAQPYVEQTEKIKLSLENDKTPNPISYKRPSI